MKYTCYALGWSYRKLASIITVPINCVISKALSNLLRSHCNLADAH